MTFAVEPKDFEKRIYLLADGEVKAQASEHDFRRLKDVCAKNDSHVAVVIDAEGEIVCFAPIAVARVIARLLDESKDFGDDASPADSVRGS
jgi:hypothetical protein